MFCGPDWYDGLIDICCYGGVARMYMNLFRLNRDRQ